MSADGLQALKVGDAVVFQDAYTSETKYGRVERGYGDTFTVHIVPREKAGPNPKPLTVGQPCRPISRPDGVRVCGSHWVALAECEIQGEDNPPGIGHVAEWACPVSGKRFLEGQGL